MKIRLLWNHQINMSREKLCPGDYCGLFGNSTDCGACPRGWRTPPNHDMCEPCNEEPNTYSWLYMIFMAALPLFYHWYYIDYKVSNIVLSKKLIFSAILETTISAVLTVLLTSPMWTFKIHACSIESIADWYTFMFNPAPNYDRYIYCTQEVVYPLYTMVFIFYFFGVLTLLLVRPWFIDKKPNDATSGIASLYAGLYLYPILAVIHAVFCGFIYYTFPYLVIIVSVISNAVHFAIKLNQSMTYLIKNTVTSTRNLFIVFIHWTCHAFGIIGITQNQKSDPILRYVLLCLVPVPTLFYILTSRLTDPRKLHSE